MKPPAAGRSSGRPERTPSPRLTTPHATEGAPRIGYVLKKFPRLSETFILNEILGHEALGTTVTVFSHRPPDDEPRHPEVGEVRGEVVLLPAFGSAGALAAFRAQASLGLEAARLEAALDFVALLPENRRTEMMVQGLILAAEARRRGIEHLHAHFMTVAAHLAHLAHLLTGIPYTVTAHAKDIYRDTVDAVVFRRVAAKARAIVTVCDANARFIRERLLAGHPGEVVRIYNGLPLEAIRDGAAPRERDLVVAVGRLVEKKGLHVLLQACRRLVDSGRSIRCIVVGDGDQRPRLEALRTELRLEPHLTLTGALPRDQALEWMRRARVLAAPCVAGLDGNQDALPTVIIEALALGLPVVSTPVAGIPEIMDHGVHGWIVPENDASALAAALAAALDDDAGWQRMALAGRPRAETRFDRRHTLPELAALFRPGTKPAASLR